MQSKEKLITIKAKIPFGGLNKICRLSKCSRITVNRFFEGELKREDKIIAIQNAILAVLKESKEANSAFFNDVEKI